MSGNHYVGQAFTGRPIQIARPVLPPVESSPAPQHPWAVEASSGIGRLAAREAAMDSARQATEFLQLNIVPRQNPTLLYYSWKGLSHYGLPSGDAALGKFKQGGDYNVDISEKELTVALGAFDFLYSQNRVLRQIYLPPWLHEDEFLPLSKAVVGDRADPTLYYRNSALRVNGGTAQIEVGYIHGSDNSPEARGKARAELAKWQGWVLDYVTLSPLQEIPRFYAQPGAAPQQPGE